MAVALDLHVLADGDRAGAAHAAEVVPAEVDEHHVLGALLRVALELLGEELVLAGVGAARTRAGDGVRREPIALGLEQELRRGADDLERRRPHEEQVRARVDAPERAVQPDAVERLARGRVERQPERLASREHDLDRLARGDGVLGDLDGVDVLLAAEARLDRRGQRRRRHRGRVARRARPGWGGRSARAPRRSPARRSGSGPPGRAPRCGARRPRTGCGSGGRRRGRGRSR